MDPLGGKSPPPPRRWIVWVKSDGSWAPFASVDASDLSGAQTQTVSTWPRLNIGEDALVLPIGEVPPGT